MSQITITHKRIETVVLEMDVEIPDGREHDERWIAEQFERQITPAQRAITDHLTGPLTCVGFEVSAHIVNGKARVKATFERELNVPAIRPKKSVLFAPRVLASQP